MTVKNLNLLNNFYISNNSEHTTYQDFRFLSGIVFMMCSFLVCASKLKMKAENFRNKIVWGLLTSDNLHQIMVKILKIDI